MQISTTLKDGISVTRISGRMDATTVSEFNEECQNLLKSGSGRIIIDEGAGRAVAAHKSLLPVGIRDVEGRFNKGDVVDIVCNGVVVAKGIIGYDSTDLKMIKGKHSDEIEFILGYKAHDDAVISENIAVLI